MKKIILFALLLIFTIVLVSCGDRTCANGKHELKCVAISLDEHVCRCVRVGCDYEELSMPHCFDHTSACLDCGIDNETVTLEFTLAQDKKSYIVSGIGSCELKHINIPSTHLGLPVTEIGDEAFWSHGTYFCEFSSVTIPEGILRIGAAAFRDNLMLKSVELPHSLTHLGESSFRNTAIESIVIPEGVLDIGVGAFRDNKSLKSVELPHSLTHLGTSAFSNTSIESIVIPEGVLHIGDGAFIYASFLKSVKLPQSLTYLGTLAFSETAIESIIIPGGIENELQSSFAHCLNLSSAVIEPGIKVLHNTFVDCTSLEDITLPEGLECLNGTFMSCKIKHFDIPNSVQTIDGAFIQSEIESINFGSGTKEITNGAFCETKIKRITIPGSIEVIGDYAFSGCSELCEVIIESGVKKIGMEAFSNCPDLTKLVIPESIEYVDFDAFDNCPSIQYNVYEGMNYLGNEEKPYLVLCGTVGATKLIVHPDTKTLAEFVLYDNESITEIEIGESVTFIPPTALRGMDGVIKVTVDVNNKTFYSVNNCIINRADKTLVKAFNCSVIPSDGSVTVVDTSAFSNLDMLETIYIPHGVKSVYINFSGCSSLKYLIIESDVTDILVDVISTKKDFAVYYCHDINVFDNITVTHMRDPNGKLPPNIHWNNAEKYIYSEEKPTLSGSFWHYVEGVPTPW